MSEEIEFGKRVIFVDCGEGKSCKINRKFIKFILDNEPLFNEVMDEFEIPENVILSFKKGDENIAGIYHVQKEHVRKHIVVIEIYTSHLDEDVGIERLVDTFVHEVVHHKVKNEEKTLKITKKIVENLMAKSL